MRLILHAGTHKTGTTTIQKVPADNREFLRDHGILYPKGGSAFPRTRVPHHRFAHGLVDPQGEAYEKGQRFIAEAAGSARDGEAILISSEPIYRHLATARGDEDDFWARRRRYLATLAALLDPFDV